MQGRRAARRYRSLSRCNHPRGPSTRSATASSSRSAMGHLRHLVPLAVVQEARWLANPRAAHQSIGAALA